MLVPRWKIGYSDKQKKYIGIRDFKRSLFGGQSQNPFCF